MCIAVARVCTLVFSLYYYFYTCNIVARVCTLVLSLYYYFYTCNISSDMAANMNANLSNDSISFETLWHLYIESIALGRSCKNNFMIIFNMINF